MLVSTRAATSLPRASSTFTVMNCGVLTLFTADTIDKSAVSSLRTDAEARLGRVTDAIVKAFVEVHDTLDAAQRKAAVTRLKSLRRAHGVHHG